MTWTTYEDIQNRWTASQALTATEEQVTTLIEDAEDTILNAFPTIQDRIDANTLPIGRVIKVVSRMVIRHLLNPTGQRSTSEAKGPFQRSVTFGGDEPGALYLTDQDRAELQDTRQGRRSAFMVDTTPDCAYGSYQYDSDLWTNISCT